MILSTEVCNALFTNEPKEPFKTQSKEQRFYLILSAVQLGGISGAEKICTSAELMGWDTAMKEMFANFQSGKRTYDPEIFPQTAKFLQLYASNNSIALFIALKTHLYCIWDCPPGRLIWSPECQRAQLVRDQAVDRLIRVLEQPNESLSEEERVAVIRVYFNGIATRKKGWKPLEEGGSIWERVKTISFWQLIKGWGGQHQEHEEKRQNFLVKVGLDGCPEPVKQSCAPSPHHASRPSLSLSAPSPTSSEKTSSSSSRGAWSFRDGLISATLNDLQEHLGFCFEGSLRNNLKKWLANEKFRSEVIYFIPNTTFLRKTNWRETQFESKSFCSGIQWLRFFVEKYHIPSEYHSAFLEVILNSDNSPFSLEFEAWKTGSSSLSEPPPPVSSASSASNLQGQNFIAAWKCLQRENLSSFWQWFSYLIENRVACIYLNQMVAFIKQDSDFEFFKSSIERFNLFVERCHIPLVHRFAFLKILFMSGKMGIQIPDSTSSIEENFNLVWQCLEEVIFFDKKGWQNLSTEGECSTFWQWFSYLIKNPWVCRYLISIADLVKLKLVSLDIDIIQRFGDENSRYDAKLSPQLFGGAYRAVVEAAQKHHSIQNFTQLFLDPPTLLSSQGTEVFENAKERTEEFASLLSAYSIDDERVYFNLLNDYLRVPYPSSLEKINQASSSLLKEKPTFSFLAEALKGIILQEVTPAFIKRAEVTLARIREKYPFFSEQQYSTLHIWALWRDFSLDFRLIERLQELCYDLKPEHIWFLLKYPSDLSLSLSSKLLEKKRTEFSRDTLKTLHFSEKFIEPFIAEISKLAEAIVSSCREIGEQVRWKAIWEQFILSTFFFPVQPVKDYQKLIRISEEGIQLDPTVQSHWGQWKSVIGESALSTYSNWLFIHGYLIFFGMYGDRDKKRATASFICLDVSIDRKNREGFLASIISKFFDIGEKLLPEDRTLTSVQGMPWSGLPYEDKVLKYFAGLKLENRRLLQASLSPNSPFAREYTRTDTPDSVAAYGDIFPLGEYGSLLPDFIITAEPTCYGADEEARALGDSSLFKVSVPKFQPLPEMKLKVMCNGQVREYPIFYKVEGMGGKAAELQGPASSSSSAEASGPICITLSVDLFQYGNRPYPLTGLVLENPKAFEDSQISPPLMVPLQYSREAFADIGTFRKHFAWQLLILKSHYYQYQAFSKEWVKRRFPGSLANPVLIKEE